MPPATSSCARSPPCCAPRAHHRRAGAHGRRRVRRAAARLPGGAGAAHRQRHPQDVSNFRFVWREKVFHVGASIGLVVLSDPAASAEEVMEQADSACYAAKEAGRDQIRVYHAKAASQQPRADMNIVETIHDAIERNGFRLFRQRIAGLDEANARARHFELLLRMVDREGKIVPPMVFIPSAERHNMMQAIDRWVIANALPAIRRECEATPDSLPVFDINLSAESINDGRFPAFVREQIALHKVPPRPSASRSPRRWRWPT
jgi:predicted signal transduction protein with EAL and GGDEF domain